MIKGKNAKLIRKTHRYLGLIIGIQFLFWTVSGLYFSWTDIDEIHGDQFLKARGKPLFAGLTGINSLKPDLKVSSLTLIPVLGEPFYWINDSILIDAKTGKIKHGISKEEALKIAANNMIDGLNVKDAVLITETGKHHEYRQRPLPAWAVYFEHPENLTAYIDARNGSFQRVRHESWRWFDFFWMFHTMDYEGRDDFNNLLLRIFSLSGLLTVFSGYLLWYISSPTVRKLKRKLQRKSNH